MERIIIFGNSGSGKSTLAKALAKQFSLSILDLDTIAWTKEEPTKRKVLADSAADISQFTKVNSRWVIEGCYADLIAPLTNKTDKLIFLNPPVETCVENCVNRPWEPHKYASIDAQNENLAMLIDWVRSYPQRDDVMALKSHRQLYDNFAGEKMECKARADISDINPDAGAGKG